MASLYTALLFALSVFTVAAEHQGTAAGVLANPIRKVVTLLQKMQAKVEDEAAKEEELFKKFMCYCKTGSSDLEKSIEAADAKVPQLQADIESAESKKAQVDDAVAQAKEDRAEAKGAMAAATAQRDKEAEAFATYKADATANIGALTKAVAALEKGASGEFLQTSAAGLLRNILSSGKQDISDMDREDISSFLQGNPFGQGYASQSGEIVGILKQMGDEMTAGLDAATKAEQKAIGVYEGLMGAKTQEVNALTEQIEEKTVLGGELAVSIAEMKNDLEDTAEMLAQDNKFLAELKKGCASKEAEWEERCSVRQQELVALAETIKILNDDDALDLFKKTLPGSASFLEVSITAKSMKARALRMLKKASARVDRSHRLELSFVTAALHGKKIGFEKIIAMIDEMVESLKTEQSDDDSKKDYCSQELDTSDDKKKALEKSISDSEAAAAAAKEGIATATEEIAALIKGIKALDVSVAAATEQRKAEHAEYKELVQSSTAAKELLKMAKNRLSKFYNPKLYKGGAAALVQVSAHTQEERRAAPPPPPETFGAYLKKTEEHGGVVQMLNLLITDLDKEITAAETDEKDAQGDYETMMGESAAKRAEDSKALAEKEKAKADMEGDLQAHTEALGSGKKDLSATLGYIHGLHLECDWSLKYYDVRKEMRASEIDALGKAKAVLSGADYSLLQTGSRHRAPISA